jgi:hypothetical protein
VEEEAGHQRECGQNQGRDAGAETRQQRQAATISTISAAAAARVGSGKPIDEM